MSTNLTPISSNEDETTPSPAEKPSLRARIKARRAEYAAKHPLRAACAQEAVKGATYAVAAGGTLIALGALMALGSKNSDTDETDEIIESDDEDILDDEEE